MTPRRSVRAAARAHYLKMRGRERVFALAPEMGQGAPSKVDVVKEGDEAMAGDDPARVVARVTGDVAAMTPTPDPSPLLARAGGGGESTAAQSPSLMTRVRALYEESAVPVREIARLAGVTERTLYRYVEKGGWKRRYHLLPRGAAAATANRGRHWQRAEGHEGVKGVGGRFILRDGAAKPVLHGIKALDPEARGRAEAACAAAAARHAKARAKADAAHVWAARRAAIDTVTAAMAAYTRWRTARDRKAAKTWAQGGPSDAERAADARMEQLLVSHIEAAIAAVKNPPFQ